MTRFTLAVTMAAVALAGCGRHTAAAEPPAAPVRGKPAAPVDVAAQLSGASARVTVRFGADGKHVDVGVHGAEGLAVTSAAAPVERATVARGDERSFDVAFTPGPGRSFLVVTVTGEFHGAGKRAKVASFAVGEPTEAQRKASGTVVEGADGERLKVVVPGK